MGSFKSDDRDRKRNRRRPSEAARKVPRHVEALEERTLLSVVGEEPPRFTPTTTELSDVKNGPLAKAGKDLMDIYLAFQGGGQQLNATVAEKNKLIQFRDNKVGVDIYVQGDLNSYVETMKNLGMWVVATDDRLGIVEGYLPYSQILAVSQHAQTIGVSPIYHPKYNQQGSVANQGDETMEADDARTQFNVDGSGVTVGVLSDSVDRFAGGLADSVSTGDLPNNVNVLLDEPVGGRNADEGRAMLELIHDIAPGASLAFNTAALGPVSFAQGIRDLARVANADIIVDDVGYSSEPAFQDGIISQAVIDVTTNDGVTYFSSAGNSDDQGYESDFRGVSGNVGGVGSGRFHDFDPTSATLTTLPLTVTQAGSMVFWWDNPFYTTNGVATDMDIFILDSNGNVVASGTTNNIATQVPQEFFQINQTGNFTVAIQVVAGPDVSRVRFQAFSAGVDVSQQFGSAGGTIYPTTFGQPVSNNAIGVGAVFYNDAPPFSNQSPIPSEGFSSFGPAFVFFDPAGNRLPARELRLKPDVSGPDGTNTTFFPPGGDIPQDPDSAPNFFGTSASAPNVAAVGALMKQLVPTATFSQIKSAMIASATTLNGFPNGSFEPQGGWGLVNAPRALAAVGQLRVLSTTPADGASLGATPTGITVNLSKPVDPSTLQASDLQFTMVPAGLSLSDIVVGTPVLINATTVFFPIQINPPAASVANGTYIYRFADGAFTSTDGSPLIGLAQRFSLADANAPRVTNTIVSGRILVVEFSEPMREATLNKGSVMLVRTGGTGSFGRAENVVVTNDPNAVLFYDAAQNRLIIDLRTVPQTVMPSDTYALVVTDEARDVSGNQLDGEFNNVFPTGNGQSGGTFAQLLGQQTLVAPQVVNFGLAPGSDTGVGGDQNTNQSRPTVQGAVVASFPGTNVGLAVAIQFLQEHPGGFDLTPSVGGRGFQGTPDLIVTTDANGGFSFVPPVDLRDGFHRVRIVVVGETDVPPLPGLSTQIDLSFRVDTTNPLVTSSSIPAEARIGSLRNLTLVVADAVAPADISDPLSVPVQLDIPALDPATANNLSNYSLINLGADRALGTPDDIDLSTFIRSAVFSSTTMRQLSSDPYTGQIDLSFADGLPSGRYVLVARTQESVFSGIRDAAGNPLDNNPALPGNQSFAVFFDLQPEPAFVTGFTALSPSNTNAGAVVTSGPRSYYEVPSPAFPNARAEAPPTRFYIDFSNTLEPRDYTNAVQLIRSADGPSATPDGDFGVGAGSGFTRVQGVTVTLESQIPGTTLGQPGYLNRLVVDLPAGTTLAPDYYRLLIQNSGNEVIRDIFGNQADLEFLGNEKPTGGQFEVLLPNGTYRDGLSGDTVQGGSFATGFVVVPSQRVDATGRVRGNIIYVRPDYNDDPFLSGDDPDGSVQRPFAALVPEAVPNFLNGGDLNSQVNFGTGFNPGRDRNANGRFDRSAFFEAQQNSAEGPVVIVTLPGIVRPVPGTTQTVQQPLVIASPAGVNPALPQNEASASVPENTMLVLGAGSTLKMFNASLFVQNQGSALQVKGGPNPNERVNITSLLDDSIGGDTNNDRTDTTPGGGNWGGLVFRNYDDISNGRDGLPGLFPVDGKLGLSGADDTLSMVNFATIRYGGGAVPQTIGTRYDSITLFNSRPSITNVVVADSATGAGAVGGSQAAISADFDSLREDGIARGPLIRRTALANNSINGVLIRPALGQFQSQQSDAIFYPNNPPSEGAERNFAIDDPLPYVLASQLVLGQGLLNGTGGQTQTVSNRLYIQPGMMVKFRPGSTISVIDTASSINIGDRTYINQFDRNPNAAPTDLGFRPSTFGDARAVLTSLFDDAATTFFFDPNTGVTRTIIPASATDNNGNNPAPAPGNVPSATRWGGISVTPGARAVIDEAEFRYGGGFVNLPSLTLPPRSVLDLTDDVTSFTSQGITTGVGAFVSVTNNNFFDNMDAAIVVEPDQLLAADPLRPLASGNPFFRGNLLQRNDVNGLAIKSVSGVVFASNGDQTNYFPIEIPIDGPNMSVSAVWDDTDITHVVRGSIVLEGYYTNSGFTQTEPVPDPNGFTAEERPFITLTVQSALPDSILANGDVIARPGESMYVKLLNDYQPAYRGSGAAIDPALADPGAADALDTNVGAGFVVGYDDGIDPPAPSPLPDFGVGSQIRFVGIGTNETTGQQRVPVVVTSLRDASVGPTVRGISQANTFFRDPVPNRFAGTALATPAAGDGGVISFGADSLTDYNLFDPRGGNLIDNADIRFLHRIEMQGGTIFDAFDLNADDAVDLNDAWRQQKLGLDPSIQYNSAQSMTISNSNLDGFRDAGLFVWQGFGARVRQIFANGQAGFPTRAGGLRGQPTNLFMVNNTIANMPVGVQINVPAGDNPTGQNPATATFLHNTFYNNGVGIRTQAPAFNGNNSLSHVYYVAMNNIFDGGTLGNQAGAAAIRMIGQASDSELQFNLFNAYGTILDDQTNTLFLGNKNPVFGSPNFFDAANGNFFPLPGSAAIDAALSEFGPLAIGDALFPISDQRLDASGGIRNAIGRSSPFGGLGFFDDPREIITLPGTPFRSFFDQFVPALPGSAGSFPGTSTNIASYNYSPIGGERDSEGFLRLDDPSTPNLGFGSRPFFDIGARELRLLDPPKVTNEGAPDVDGDGLGDGVVALVRDANGTQRRVNIYAVNGVLGTNQSLDALEFQFDERLDPATVNNLTVRLLASGGDGIFGNNNSTRDRAIDLSGKLSFDQNTRRLIVSLGSSNLILTNDLYRVILLGTGGNVLRDPQGNALDGENLDATGNQLPLPSGDDFPGGNFVLTFSVDTNPPLVTPGSFSLDPASDSAARDAVTNTNPPSFTGNITDIFPPTNPLVNQLVLLDIDVDGDFIFERVGVATARTDNFGNFRITYGVDAAGIGITPPGALPDTNFDVGPDGILGPSTGDDSGYSFARVRVIDPSGNSSDPNDLNAVAGYVLDTQGPRITGVTPTPNSQTTTSGGRIRVTFQTNENLSEASLRTQGALQARRAGLDGVFNTADDVTIQIDTSSIQVNYLRTGPKGPVEVAFDVIGATTNDVYRITVSSAVTDVAGNPLDGEYNGSFPTGNGSPGGDFNLDLVVFTPGQSRIIYVGPGGGVGATGSRNNPYASINQGLAVAGIGDTVAVLPGTYAESVTLKSLVKLTSAASSSTNTQVVQGTSQQTIIRAPINQMGSTITVGGTNLLSLSPSLRTEMTGFTIASPLSSVSTGSILSDSIGVLLIDSGVYMSDNYVINAGVGVHVVPAEGSLPNLVLENNGLIGNLTGLYVDDRGNTTTGRTPVQVTNNTFAFNNTGLTLEAQASSPLVVDATNNIFWQNRNRSANSGGLAVLSTNPSALRMRSNLFSANGTNLTSTADDAAGTPFDPAALGTTPDANGNFTGDPAFQSPRDPRPGFDGPTIFLLDGNFDLTVNSAAIDAALNSSAPTTDFLGRPRIETANRGFVGFGPADVGAFEYSGPAPTGGGTTTPPPGGGTTNPPPTDGGGVIFFGLTQAGTSASGSTETAPDLNPASTSTGYTVEVNTPTTVPTVQPGRPAQAGPGRRAYLESVRRRSAGPEQTATPSPTALPSSSRPFTQFFNRVRGRRPSAS